ncbi:solute carrier family 23 protein [Escherichia coli]
MQLTWCCQPLCRFCRRADVDRAGLSPGSERFCTTHSRTGSGGATLVMFGTIAASGGANRSREPLNRSAILIIALSLAVGLGASSSC